MSTSADCVKQVARGKASNFII